MTTSCATHWMQNERETDRIGLYYKWLQRSWVLDEFFTLSLVSLGQIPFSSVRNAVMQVSPSSGYYVCLSVFKLPQKALLREVQYFLCKRVRCWPIPRGFSVSVYFCFHTSQCLTHISQWLDSKTFTTNGPLKSLVTDCHTKLWHLQCFA